MSAPAQNSAPYAHGGRGMLRGKAASSGSTKRLRRQPDPDLEIAEDIFGGDVLRALVDEWLVPAIVDGLIRDLMNAAMENAR